MPTKLGLSCHGGWAGLALPPRCLTYTLSSSPSTFFPKSRVPWRLML